MPSLAPVCAARLLVLACREAGLLALDSSRNGFLRPVASQPSTLRAKAEGRLQRGPMHEVAERHERKFGVAFSYAFAAARRALGRSKPSANAAVKAMQRPLRAALPRLLLKALSDGGSVAASALGMRIAAFNENQPRDDHGRWTDGDFAPETKISDAKAQSEPLLRKQITEVVRQEAQTFNRRYKPAQRLSKERLELAVEDVVKRLMDDGEATIADVFGERKSHVADMVADAIEEFRNAGGSGSGNFGHAGRPGQIGGSSKGDISEHEVVRELPRAVTIPHYTDGDSFVISTSSDRLIPHSGSLGKGGNAFGKNRIDVTLKAGTKVYELTPKLWEAFYGDREVTPIQVGREVYDRAKSLGAQVIKVDGRIHGLGTEWAVLDKNAIAEQSLRIGGGPGSGNFGHAGRPGEVGGSITESDSARKERVEREWQEYLATKPPVIYYHGTQSHALESIKKDGLIPLKGKGADEWAKDNGWNAAPYRVGDRAVSVYMTPVIEDAKLYADYARQVNPDSTPVLLRIKVPYAKVMTGKSFDRFIETDEQSKSGTAVRVKGSIPPEWIEVVEEKNLQTLGGSPDIILHSVFAVSANSVVPRLAAKHKFKFNVASQEAVDWADRHAGELISNISESTRQSINDAIAEALEHGTIDEAYEEILAAIGDTERARLIARHETMTAASEGQRQAWSQAVEEGFLTGDERRTWIAVGDEKVCPTCGELDGTLADLDGEYADGIVGPPAHVQCRCTEGLA